MIYHCTGPRFRGRQGGISVRRFLATEIFAFSVSLSDGSLGCSVWGDRLFTSARTPKCGLERLADVTSLWRFLVDDEDPIKLIAPATEKVLWCRC